MVELIFLLDFSISYCLWDKVQTKHGRTLHSTYFPIPKPLIIQPQAVGRLYYSYFKNMPCPLALGPSDILVFFLKHDFISHQYHHFASITFSFEAFKTTLPTGSHIIEVVKLHFNYVQSLDYKIHKGTETYMSYLCVYSQHVAWHISAESINQP